jgi:hypothetical protein
MPMEPIIAVNIEPSKRLLARMRSKVVDLTPVLDGPITNRVYEMFGKIWATEGRYIGHPWPKLAPSTLKAKARIHREGMGILRRYNTLWASMTKRGAPKGIRVVTPSSLAIGTSVSYAAAHQEGNERLPQRQFIPDPEDIPKKDRDEWDDLMVTHIES